MNRFSLYFELFKYALLHPRSGLNMIQGAREARNDASRIVFDYKSTHEDVKDVLKRLVSDESFSLNEFQDNLIPLQNHLREFFKQLESEKYPSKKKPYPTDYSLTNYAGFFLYFLCKIIKPNKVVETGVAYGNSSSYILQALHENKKGELYSIDSVFRPWQTRSMIGSAIPAELKSRWHFVFGTSSEKLPQLLMDLNKIDIFFHDSLHTFKNMKFEFGVAWPFIRSEGFLLSDDISGNNAFYEFYKSLKLEPVIIGTNKELLGVIRKPNYD